MEVFRPPSASDPRHFAVGDRVLFGYGEEGSPALTLTSVPDEDGCLRIRPRLIATASSDYRASVTSLIHERGCQPCADFSDQWQLEQDRLHSDHRDGFTPAARTLADDLSDYALTQVQKGRYACGHGDTYELDARAPLPEWFHTALRGAVFTEPEGPWPNWGRTTHPVDWPRMIADHPDVLVPDHDMLSVNDGPTWDAVATAFAVVRRSVADAALDVMLWVAEDGRITVDPGAILASRDLSVGDSVEVDRILAAGGRRIDALHDDDGVLSTRRGWMLTG